MRSRTARETELPPDENERVIHRLKQIRDQEGSVLAMSRRVGVSQPSLHNAIAGNNGASLAMARAIADFDSVPLDVLLRADHTDPHPARARALARLRYLLPREVEAVVRSANVSEEWSETQWFRFILSRLDDHEMTLRANVTTTATKRRKV